MMKTLDPLIVLGLMLSTLLIFAPTASGFITLGTSGVDYSAWIDNGIVFAAGSLKAYYPSVLYDANGFPDIDGPDHHYKMWYGTESSQVAYAYSDDGLGWNNVGVVTGAVKYHAKVIYDANQFGGSGGDPYYKMWFWNTPTLYSIDAIGYAESGDGINWVAGTTTQGTPKLVESGWNRGSYGPVEVIYNPSGSTSIDTAYPFNNRYVMYYDGTTGGDERIGLALSSDGKQWVAYDGNSDGKADIIVDGTQEWELRSGAAYVTFGSIIRDNDGYHLLYSGGRGKVNEGIGLAHSTDGISWTKYSGNPIFHITDSTTPAGYRSKRTYTPSIINDGSGELKMYYSAVSGGTTEDYAIGLATLKLPGAKTMKQRVLDDLMALRAPVTDKEDGHKLDEAIKHLTKSLDPGLWVDETRLDGKHGDKVFNEEKDAVVKLLELLKDKKSTVDKATLQDFINRLVDADKALAKVAIDDAVAAGGDAKKIHKANEELSKGDARVLDGKFVDAIEHYRNAWKHATKAA